MGGGILRGRKTVRRIPPPPDIAEMNGGNKPVRDLAENRKGEEGDLGREGSRRPARCSMRRGKGKKISKPIARSGKKGMGFVRKGDARYLVIAIALLKGEKKKIRERREKREMFSSLSEKKRGEKDSRRGRRKAGIGLHLSIGSSGGGKGISIPSRILRELGRVIKTKSEFDTRSRGELIP